jgi:signal recognition particle subunit SRP54
MFEQLTGRLQSTLRKLRGSVKIDEKSFAAVSRELRLALLEADVNFAVVKDFLARVKVKALGQEVLESLSPGQQVIKIVNDEMTRLLGGETQELRLDGRAPHIIMIVGLQGAGKTTTVGKLGTLLRSQGRSPLLASVDVYRPAAREQLRVLGEQTGLTVFDEGSDDPRVLATAALAEARRRGDDVLILDTAGRLHVDDEMMQEVVELADLLEPERILYVADSLAGQDAVQAARAFADALALDGHILTKLDGDSRGGAALSVVAVTGRPIFFAGTGERIQDLEPFHPERIASRILGMGDVLSLIEKVQGEVDLESAKGLEKKVRRGEFTLVDFQDQLRQIRRMGSFSQILELLPGAAKAPGLADMAPDESELGRIDAIISSMTMQERLRPRIVNGSRRRRIAAGSGTAIQDVNRLLKNFARTQKMMKKLGKKGRRGSPWANIPGL